MIEKLERIAFKESEIKNLKFIEPYWISKINKSIKKLKDWKNRFPDFESVDLPFINEETNYNDFALRLDKYKDFIEKKYKMIISNKNVYIKFSKNFSYFINVYGYLSFFKIASSLFEEMNTNEIQSKRQYVINKINSLSKPWFNKIIDSYRSVLNNDEYLDVLIENIIFLDNEIFNPQLVFKKLSLYTRKLIRQKKLKEDNMLKINIDSFELTSFIVGIANASYKFLISLNT